MDTRTSSRSKRPLDRKQSPEDSNDGELSSGSHGSNRSRRTSPNKLKRALKKEITQKFNWKCNPQKIANIVKQFTPRQKQWVQEMGFQSVLTMAESKLPRRLLLGLLKRVDCKTMSLILKNRRISIIDAVEDILKFPAGPLEVKMPPAGNPRDKSFINLDKFRSEKGGRGQSLAEEEEILLKYKNEGDKDKFWLSFMEVLLCCYLAPTTSNLINRHYVLGALKDVSKIPEMNWCRFAVNYLIRDIKEIRTKTVENINLQGCLHIIIVMFIDLVKKSDLDVPAETPRINFVTNEMLEEVESCCRKRDRNEDGVFENLLDDEKLGKFSLVESSKEQEGIETYSEGDYALAEEDLVEAPKRQFKQTSSQQNCILTQLKAIDAKYAGEREKIIKNHEIALRKKLQELESKRLKEVEELFQHNANTSVSLPEETIQKNMESGKNTPASEIHEHQTSRSEKSDGACDNMVDDTSPIAGDVPSTTDNVLPTESHNRPVSPLQETVDIAADACHMATIISAHEGVDLNDFEPGSQCNQQQLSATQNPSATKSSDIVDNLSKDRDSLLEKSFPKDKSDNEGQSLVQQDVAPVVQSTEVHSAVDALTENEKSDDTPTVQCQLEVQDQSVAKDVPAEKSEFIDVECIVPSQSHPVEHIQVSNVAQDLPLVTEARDSVLVVTESQNCPPVVTESGISLPVVSESQIPLLEVPESENPVHVVASEPASIQLMKSNDQSSTLPANAIKEEPNSNPVVQDSHTSVTDQIVVNDDPVGSSSLMEARTVAEEKHDSRGVAMESNVVSDKVIDGDCKAISANDVQVSVQSDIPQDEIPPKKSDKILENEFPSMDTSSGNKQDEACNKNVVSDTAQEKSAAIHGLGLKPSPKKNAIRKFTIKFKGPSVSDSNLEAKQSPMKKVDKVKEKTVTGSTILVLEDNILESIPAAPTSKDTAPALIGVPKKEKTKSKLDARMTDIGRKTSSKPRTQEVLDVLTENEKQVDIVARKKSARKEVIHIKDSNVTPSPKHHTQVPPVEDAIRGGESFMYAGSVNTANKSRPQRFQRNEQATEGISELVLMNRISPSSELNKVYTDNVMNSRFKGLRLRRTDDDGGTKMQLTKPFRECDHASLARRLSKLNLDEIEQLYLPTCHNNDWIAVVVNFTHNAFEIYDSKQNFKEGEQRYKSLLNKMAANLKKAYSDSQSGGFPNIEEMPKHYKSAGVQNNNKDCGFWVV